MTPPIGRRAIYVLSETAREVQNLPAIAFPTGTRHRFGDGHLTTTLLAQSVSQLPDGSCDQDHRDVLDVSRHLSPIELFAHQSQARIAPGQRPIRSESIDSTPFIAG